MLTYLPVPYDLCVGVPISCLLTIESMPVKHNVLIVKAPLGASNQEKDNLRFKLYSVLLKSCIFMFQ